jgi:CO/xanthine dehydrogenase Mo-binding subunit
MLYDEGGQLITGTLMEYVLPSIRQTAPDIETIQVEVPSEHGPFGARGVGEAPVVPTAAAIANAVADATGVRLTDLPLTAPKVWAALHGENGRANGA